jgi:type I restriction-modification system DNA methylase subunit
MSKAQYQLNTEIEHFIHEKEAVNKSFSKEDIAFINQFTGYGGLASFGAEGKGLLSEYFTPIEVVEKMIALATKFGFVSGPVLEPSCGIGRFLHYFSPKQEVDAFEINEISYKIAKLNFPTFNIQHQYFNELFVERNGKPKPINAKYNLVIGNPPYGDFTGKFSSKERQVTKATRYEEYFITRGLDMLKKNGLLIYIIPSGFLDSGDSVIKTEIMKKAELLDAYRLPKGIFKQTDIQTDIVIFKRK